MTTEVHMVTYLIRMEGTPRRPGSSLVAANGADTLLVRHERNSVADMVGELCFQPEFTADDVLPDLFHHNDVMIVSEALRAAIEPFLRDFEFLPVAMELARTKEAGFVGGGERRGGYYWLNCWRRLDVIDWSASATNAEQLRKGQEEEQLRNPSRVRNVAKGIIATNWTRLNLRTSFLEGEHLYGFVGMLGEQRYLSDELYRHLAAQKLRIQFAARMLEPHSGTERASTLRRRLNGLPLYPWDKT